MPALSNSHNSTSAPENHDHEHSHDHEHRRFYSTKTFRLVCMLALTFSFFGVELVVGNITNSLALVADAFHMLSDVIALLIALLAVRMSRRRSNINTYGWVRGEIVGANVNTVFLLALCLTIVFDVIRRYITPAPIKDVNLLLIVGSVGLGINIIGLFLFQGFHGHSHAGRGEAHAHQTHGTSRTKKRKQDEMSNEDLETAARHESTQANASASDGNSSDDIEVLNSMPGPTDFKRHSTRALEEVIADCVSNVHGHSHEHAPGNMQPDIFTTGKFSSVNEKQKKKKEKSASMNMHGVFLHVLADALGSIVVIISALVIKFVPHDPTNLKHWTIYIDPTLSLIIVMIVGASAIPLFKETSFILLQTIPNHIELDELKNKLLKEVPEVKGIHELHIWRLTDQKIIASAHLNRRSLVDYMSVADKVKQFFHSMGIHSTTMQYEYDCDDRPILAMDQKDDRDETKVKRTCLLSCADDACNTLTCCTEKSIGLDTKLKESDGNNILQRRTNASTGSSTRPADGCGDEHGCTQDHNFHTHIPMEGIGRSEKF